MRTGALLSQVYKKTFWNTYDHIGTVILTNLLWFAIFPLPTFLCFRYVPLGIAHRVVLTIVVGLMTNAFAMSGLFGITSRIANYEDSSIRHFLAHGRRLYWRIFALSLIYATAVAILVVGIRFYLGWKALGGLPGFALAGWQVTILAFVLLTQAYVMPLATLRDHGVWQTMKWSAILTILKPGYTVLVFLQAVAIFVLVSLTGIGIAVLALALVAIFLNTATRELWHQIEAHWKPGRKPTSWREIFRERERGEEESRSLKDLLHPWDV